MQRFSSRITCLYDALSRVVTVTQIYFDDRDATGYGMTYTYNLAGMRVTELDPESAALGLSWSMRYTYDALGRLFLTENIEGTIARTEYDLAGNVVRQTVRENASAPEQTILTATYDLSGNVLTQ